MTEQSCPKGHGMSVLHRFRFDHEPGDPQRDHATLHRLHSMGIELGADVTVWYCVPCDYANAQFVYPERA
jgi:hypothetical protein